MKDLRSAVVREACNAIVFIAETLGNQFKKLAWVLLPTLINLSASGNKVISGYVSECVHNVLKHTHVTRGIPAITELVKHRYAACVAVGLRQPLPHTLAGHQELVCARKLLRVPACHPVALA